MDELIGRGMPHSLEAEQSVLGAMLIDTRAIPEVLTVVKKPSDFYLETNRAVFETICTMFNHAQAIDPVTVLDQMRIDGTATEGTARYLVELMRITPTAVNVMEYAAIVADKALLRAVAQTAGEMTDLVHQGGGTAQDVLEVAEKKIFALRQNRSTEGLLPVSQVLQNAYTQISEAAKRDTSISGITTGLADLDRAIMGLNKSDLILIASRPGMGKTSIALNIALSAAKSTGKAVAVFSLEMSREQLAMRLLSGESEIDSLKLKKGKLSPAEWKGLAAAAASISRTKILIDDNSALTVSEMNAQCRRVGSDLGLIMIDYLQLMSSAGSSQRTANQNRTQVVSEISRYLKIMAKELNVPVIVLSQLNRDVESRTSKRPMLSDLRESGAIEQDADIVLGLYREGYYDRETENPNAAECIILKNRQGELGTVDLLWVPEHTAYRTLEKRYDNAGY